jgi:hypothetical protein
MLDNEEAFPYDDEFSSTHTEQVEDVIAKV